MHDPENQCEVGDFVTLGKCLPISKTKRFVVIDIRRAKVTASSAKLLETLGTIDEGILPELESASQ